MTTKVCIDGLRLYCRHGVMEQEQRVGQEFEVNLEMEIDYDGTDSVESVVDYSLVVEVVKSIMSTPSKLIEHAAYRVHSGLCAEFPSIRRLKVTVVKLCPPLGAQLRGISATIED